MVSDEYLAGLLDGEGHISLVHRPRREDDRRSEMQSHIVVSLTMCDRQPLDAIAERFGGAVYEMKAYSDRWRRAYRWQHGGRPAEKLLRAARPHLLVKHRQADLCLEFRESLMIGGRATPKRAAYNDRVLQRRLEMVAEMKELNRRGRAA